MKVEIIDEESKYALEEKLNSKINKVGSYYDIIDIKFSGNGCWSVNGIEHWSAMIIYK